MPFLYTTAIAHRFKRKTGMGFAKRQETMGDFTIPTKERTEPNSDTTVYCASVFYWWDTSFDSQHDRFFGPICHR